MKISDLTAKHEELYFHCLEDWSEEIKEGGEHKRIWYEKMKSAGLRVKLAEDDEGKVGGMIQYVPIDRSPAEGRDLYFVHCIWVHGYSKGRGNFQKKGMGRELLRAAEEDARGLGAKGLAVWGLSLPFFMRASWFKKQGYKPVDKMGMMVLLWKPFAPDASPPRWIRRKKAPQKNIGKVTVSVFKNGWCPAMNMVYERAKRAVAEHGGSIVWQEYDTCNRDIFLEWGLSDALFIDGKEVRTGPPPSYEKLSTLIGKRVKRLKSVGRE
jgi:GNAT superfamily N-acetyltransferase